ncbi:Mrp/NBP35 family ATP-binding protein [bacterium]|nr:Mrp/NBP35 family ATP-binding protein [bacterium]
MASNPFEQQAPIENVDKIITVGSGKGGVGKSTISVNLALALKAMGKSVGLLDLDIYGPSIPRMLGAINQKPEVENDRIIPIERLGLKIMSMGFLIAEEDAVIWRGPMLFKAIEQFFRDVNWGKLDYLIIDLPPGTGDVPLTVAQKVPIDGSITVCTPQNMALIDAKKAIDMFEKSNVPQLGVVENMSYFQAPGSDEKVQLFPKGELDSYLEKKGISKISEIPFNPQVAMGGETGIPVIESYSNGPEAQAFKDLASQVENYFN